MKKVVCSLVLAAAIVSMPAVSVAKERATKVVKDGKIIYCLNGEQVTKKGRQIGNSKTCAALKRKAKAVAKALKTNNGLAALPSTNDIARNSQSATALDVSGTPPLITAMARGEAGSIKEIFWRAGVVDAIASGSASAEQCNEFWGGNTDSHSGGLTACYMTQNVGYAAQNLAQNGISACYMKNFPSTGAATLVSGELPDNDITKIFTTPSGNTDRVVKITMSGEDVGSTIYITIFSTATNARRSDSYGYQLAFCEGGATAASLESVRLSTSGKLSSVSFGAGGDEGGKYSSKLTAFLSSVDGDIVFDPTKDREAEVSYIADSSSHKSKLIFTASGQIENLTYDDFGGDEPRRAYSVSSYSGSSMTDLRFLEGAAKDENFSSTVEYRGTYYAAAPENTLAEELDSVNLDTHAFFNTLPQVDDSELAEHSCDADADVVLELALDNPAMDAVRELCEGDRIDGMDFCRSDSTVQLAEQNWFSVCSGGGGPE